MLIPQILFAIAGLLFGYLLYEFGYLVGQRRSAEQFKATIELFIRITEEMQETVDLIVEKNVIKERKKK